MSNLVKFNLRPVSSGVCRLKHFNHLSANPTKMVKHTQTIRRQYVRPLCGLALKGLICFNKLMGITLSASIWIRH